MDKVVLKKGYGVVYRVIAKKAKGKSLTVFIDDIPYFGVNLDKKLVIHFFYNGDFNLSHNDNILYSGEYVGLQFHRSLSYQTDSEKDINFFYS